MAKLVTKFKYLKPCDRGGKRNRGGYAKYIATREGVEKIDDSKRHAAATLSQKKLIEKILRDFPDSRQMLEYEDYTKQSTIENASEFITRALEDNAGDIIAQKTYADYIATRPRAERFGAHGLFTDEGVEVNLSKVSEDLNKHGGNVWTVIISLRREDAERLGYNNGSRWRDMLRTQTEALAVNLKVPMENLRWFAAFHNESHHPHVHLLAYSVIENEGYLTPKGVSNLRSAFARDIFAQDLLCIYEKQTMHRNEVKENSRKIMEETLEALKQGNGDNAQLEKLLLTLNERLSNTSGKKIYGYLKADVKDIVDAIVEELEKDERIKTLYDLWYEQQEAVIQTYTQELPKRIPLAENNEFKSIKNMIIREAMQLKTVVRMDEPEEIKDMETMKAMEIAENMETMETMEEMEAIENTGTMDDMEAVRSTGKEKCVEPLEKKAAGSRPELTSVYETIRAEAAMGNRWSQYGFAKMFLDKESPLYDPQEAVRWLTASAEQGYTVAQYMLGKLFLTGEHVQKDVKNAVRWLEKAIGQNNSYAEYLLGRQLLRGTDMEQDVGRAVKLLQASANQQNRYAAYTLGKAYLDGIFLPKNTEQAIRLLTMSADRGFPAAQYVMGKLLYRGEGTDRDIERAIRYLTGAAKQNNSYAEYQLGKIYLYGGEAERDYEQAIAYLNAAAEHGNPYAKQLLSDLRHNRNLYTGLGVLLLLHHTGRILQNRMEEGENGGNRIQVDRKLRRKIEAKKQAHGLKQG
ncbi:MAG: relaxase MobL [Bacteroides sp.]|nr:relaxase MobL [Bacteroides sp.]MCM1548846.1 relaxase MobL [Clostridium sp.]